VRRNQIRMGHSCPPLPPSPLRPSAATGARVKCQNTEWRSEWLYTIRNRVRSGGRWWSVLLVSTSQSSDVDPRERVVRCVCMCIRTRSSRVRGDFYRNRFRSNAGLRIIIYNINVDIDRVIIYSPNTNFQSLDRYWSVFESVWTTRVSYCPPVGSYPPIQHTKVIFHSIVHYYYYNISNARVDSWLLIFFF